ncbi:Fe-S cluster assembly protein SufD [Terribacillus sp. AE2B 122]|uniref:Fe-S cluster assembly protein SufD n=1 Tax=Terribacillus sp. AE2B 122 TaxID=1331902 RepID=UPI0015839E75|nr:Fe-S cluster assembly protein SufD [Terribacillus sp. AE2B 122]
MTVETKQQYNDEYISRFSSSRNEPEWMKELRQQALSQSESLDMPKPDKTGIKNWDFDTYVHEVKGEKISALGSLPASVAALIDADNAPNLYIQRNNSAAYLALNEKWSEQGVIFTDIFTALQQHGDLVKRFYMKDAVNIDEDRLTALHAALMNGGVFVYVPKNVVVDEPLQTIFWQEDDKVASFNHILIVAEANSAVTYVENSISHNAEQATFANVVTEVIAADNANVSYGAVDNYAAGTTVYAKRRGVAYRDARIDWAIGQMNDGNTISEHITHLIGDNSSSEAKSVVVGRGKQIQNFTTNIVHFGQNSVGSILSHGVMKDQASSVFNGIGKIEHGASKSDATQETRVLMLSQGARGDANPILLIDEDDVVAGHAASVGRVDPLQLYYLMSRGITKHEAERLIIHGFLAPVVNQLPIETVKNQLTQVIEGKVN